MRDCPPWSKDVDEHRSPAFATGATEVLEQACARCKKAIPNRGDVERWHRDLFKRWVPLDYYAGNVRQSDLRRVCLGIDVQVNGVPAVHHGRVMVELDELFAQARRRIERLELRWREIDDSARVRELATIIGVVIGRFIHIHPFVNGNGRASRFLWCVLLSRFGLPPHLSVVRRPAGPYGDVMAAAMKADYAPAVDMVLNALAKAPPPATLPLPI